MPRAIAQSAIASVLQRLGIDPSTRFDEADQDAEYTACRAAELDSYFTLHLSNDITAAERDVLTCFMFESLNDLAASGETHENEQGIVALLLSPANSEELAYWMNTEDPDEDNWWPLTRVLLRHAADDRANSAPKVT